MAATYHRSEFYARVDGEHSEWFPVPAGVRQGCVWSPLLIGIVGTLSNEDGNVNDDGSENSLFSFVLYFFVQVIGVLFRCFKFCE